MLERKLGRACLVSFALHIGVVAIALIAIRASVSSRSAIEVIVVRSHAPLIWLLQSGPGGGGGGGGGGDRTPAPPRKAESPGTDSLTVPVARSRAVKATTQARTDLEPVPRLDIPVVPLALGTETLPGATDAPSLASMASRGPGGGDGTGGGLGPGDGPGRGDGLGDGSDRGTDGDVYRPGGDVTVPIEIRKGAPQYTTAAMHARAQGTILVECIVQTTGVCTNIRVKRSLDPAFGLDQEAIKAAAEWRFRAGTRRGQPVPVLVTLEIAFALR